ncbi:YqaE/Pmp3 family membrane protein [Yunchengibacter salinarum]|uniref:YqaE/Pmp3 family membrane protein n=1 Tax=Yunchengibacter salinarum TaxID=3133399 RepID=UPI0035B57A25
MGNLLIVILAIFLPPVAVLLRFGLGGTFLLNLILTLLFFVPGMIHALWVILNNPGQRG